MTLIKINKRQTLPRIDSTFSPVQIAQVQQALEAETHEKGSIEEALFGELSAIFFDEILLIKLKRQGKIKISLSLTQARVIAFLMQWYDIDKAVKAALFELK
jgi:hypothetical protein